MIEYQTINEVASISANGLQGCLRKPDYIDWPLTSSVIVDEGPVSDTVVQSTCFHKGGSP